MNWDLIGKYINEGSNGIIFEYDSNYVIKFKEYICYLDEVTNLQYCNEKLGNKIPQHLINCIYSSVIDYESIPEKFQNYFDYDPIQCLIYNKKGEFDLRQILSFRPDELLGKHSLLLEAEFNEKDLKEIIYQCILYCYYTSAYTTFCHSDFNPKNIIIVPNNEYFDYTYLTYYVKSGNYYQPFNVKPLNRKIYKRRNYITIKPKYLIVPIDYEHSAVFKDQLEKEEFIEQDCGGKTDILDFFEYLADQLDHIYHKTNVKKFKRTQKFVYQCINMLEKYDMIGKFSSLKSLLTHEYFDEIFIYPKINVYEFC
jgi:Fe-S oxidoreductase